MIKEVRKIDGVSLTMDTKYKLKRDAQRRARILRKLGGGGKEREIVRVIRRGSGYWGVYYGYK